MRFKAGDRVFYVLPRGNGRPAEVRLPAEVVTVTKKRIVIRVDGSRNHRNVLPISLIPETTA